MMSHPLGHVLVAWESYRQPWPGMAQRDPGKECKRVKQLLLGYDCAES